MGNKQIEGVILDILRIRYLGNTPVEISEKMLNQRRCLGWMQIWESSACGFYFEKKTSVNGVKDGEARR